MELLAHNKYRVKDVDKERLKSFGFYYDKTISNIESDYYSYKFPVYKYENIALIYAVLSIDTKDGSVLVNVYKANSKECYAPFYQNQYGNYQSILNIINKNILMKFKKIGIERYE